MAKAKKRIATEYCVVEPSKHRPGQIGAKSCFWRNRDAQAYMKRVKKLRPGYYYIEKRRVFRALSGSNGDGPLTKHERMEIAFRARHMSKNALKTEGVKLAQGNRRERQIAHIFEQEVRRRGRH